MYDGFQSDLPASGCDNPLHTLRKEATWISFVTLKPQYDLVQESQMSRMRTENNIDLLLQAQFNFIKASDAEVKYSFTLREFILRNISLKSCHE